MIRSGYVIVLFQLVALSRAQDCPQYGYYNIAQFGGSCQYRCRCVNEAQCDRVTGSCTNGCAHGWMGPGCQYRNLVALKNSTAMSNGTSNTASLAGDGDTTTCTTLSASGSQVPFWTIAFSQAFHITGLILKVKTETTFNFRVEGSNDRDFNSNILCYQHQNTRIPTELEIMCMEVMTVKHVRIIASTRSQTLELCEVEVYGGRYISYRGVARQSSTFLGIVFAVAEHAVDGRPMHENDDQEHDGARTCAITNSGSPEWWNLEFPTEMLVQGIFVYGRRLPLNPIYSSQSANFNVNAISADGSTTLIYTDSLVGSSWEDYQPRVVEQAVVTSKHLSISKSMNNHLSLCEVEVFAECVSGKCGWDCLDVCHCSTVATGSYRKDGRCPYGCIHRWTGQNGRCDQTCSDNKWGPNCTMECFCSAGSQCNIDNGTCPGECAVGWKGHTCNLKCDNNMYGQNCNESCGRCSNNTQCHHAYGYCTGCEPGWRGNLCKQPCPDMRYGQGCKETCGKCFNSAPCNKSHGHCVSCDSGYKGDLCKQNCANGHYGYNCNEACGSCKDNSSCDIYTGQCQGECQPGWQGSLCKTECNDTYYGHSCLQTCGKCLNSAPCDKVSGICNSCDKGYKGTLCQQQCSAMEYGYNCNKTCGRCENGSSCDMFSGHCPGDCEPGLQLPLCKYECNGRFYGVNCNSSCGFCIDNEPCDKVTGNCTSCNAGYEGDLCMTPCIGKRFGHNCSNTCGSCINNTVCNTVSGYCPGKCESGYTDPFCITLSADQDDKTGGDGSFPIGVVIGVLAGLIVVAAVALGLFIFIRRRSSNPNKATQLFGKSVIDDTQQLRSIPINEQLKTDTFSVPVEKGVELTYEDVNEDHIYMNKDMLSKPISVLALKAYCQKIKHDPSPLSEDFELLPKGRQFATTKALKHTNMRKNRYKELYPYDKNVVSLPLIPGIEDSDFISASYINGFEKPKRYIASQGAMKDTVNDAWRMIWSHNIATVVMLTKCYELGKLKCERYWPVEGSIQYGDITVKTQLTDEYAEYTIRTFELRKNGTSEIKHTKQYHFTGWPDKDVPDDTLSLVQFWRIVKQSENAAASPWMVHCSAGIGRTGTFIALDYLFDQGKATNTVDVKQCAHELRDQRVNMVQTKDQYEFVHQAVQEALNPVGTAFHVDEFHAKWKSLTGSKDSDEKGHIFQEYKAISEESIDKQDDSEYVYGSFNTYFSKDDFSESLKPENTEKSRTLTILPQNKNRPILSSSAKYQSQYINAVFMSVYRKKNGLVLNQLPLQCTVIDTLRMIWQYNMRTIIIMEHTVPKESRYWPGREANVINLGIFAVELVSEESNGGVITRVIKIKLDTQVREIVQFHYQLWPDSSPVPENSSSILRLVTDADTMMRKLGSDCPLLVQCLDGATRSGLFCIMWSILERIQSTNTVAIAETVRLAKVRRKQIIPNYEQYRFCWETIREQIESADVYGNVI